MVAEAAHLATPMGSGRRRLLSHDGVEDPFHEPGEHDLLEVGVVEASAGQLVVAGQFSMRSSVHGFRRPFRSCRVVARDTVQPPPQRAGKRPSGLLRWPLLGGTRAEGATQEFCIAQDRAGSAFGDDQSLPLLQGAVEDDL